MSEGAYIFEDAADARELARLRALEAIFDPHTQRHLASTGAWTRRHCLEAGAGAGSIAAWMRSQVGEGGRVVAVDANTRFLEPLRSVIDVVQGDLRGASLPHDAFDVVHARYVLIHNADAKGVLDVLLRCLKPGGFILLEEPDFSTASSLAGPEAGRRAFDNVCRAIEATFANRGMSHSFGRHLPALIRERGLELVAVELDTHVERGGSPLAKMMDLSTRALHDKYVATGHVTAADLAGHAGFAADPECWGIYYSTGRVLGRKLR